MLVQLAADTHTGNQANLGAAAWGITRPTNRAQWNAAFRLFQRDMVSEALDMVASSSTGESGEFVESLQIIEAEARTSNQSEITRFNYWLEVESTNRSGIGAEEIGRVAVEAISKVWTKIGLKIGPEVLVTFLADNVVLPPALEPAGYVSLKRPYAKYCLPASCLIDGNISGQVQRLASCHAAALISGSSAPPWLIAAAAALSDVSVSKETRYGFCSGGIKWREPFQLNRRLRGRDLDPDPIQTARNSLDQALLIGQYLLDKGGTKNFRDLIAYHSPASVLHYFVLLFSNDPNRDACKKYYGFAPEYLFEQALASCCK